MSVIVNTCPVSFPIGFPSTNGLNTLNILSTPPVTRRRAFEQ